MADTRAEIMEMIKAAHAAGDAQGAARLTEMYDATPTAGTDEPGLFQSLFDVRNAATGESYLYGNKPKPSTLDDIMRVGTDTVSRGFADKVSGGGALTEEARDRMPDYLEAPLDVVAAVGSAPYRIGSSAVGALAGGLEGAATAYGHQDDWVPSPDEAGDILWEGGKGAALGAGGAQLGKWIGKSWSKIAPGEAPVQGPPTPPSTPKLSKVGTAVHAAAKQPLATTVPVDVGLHMLGIPPVATGTARAARVVRPAFQPKVTPGAGPIQPEPVSVEELRDLFAQAMIGYGRSQ